MCTTPSLLESRLAQLVESSGSGPVLGAGVRIDFAFTPPQDAARVAELLR
jgi:hypothetical protein